MEHVFPQLTCHSDHSIRSIDLTETFQQEDDEKLTAEEEKEAEQIYKDEQLKRTDPAAYRALVAKRDQAQVSFKSEFLD